MNCACTLCWLMKYYYVFDENYIDIKSNINFFFEGEFTKCSKSECEIKCDLEKLIERCNFNETSKSNSKKVNYLDETYEYYYKFDVIIFISEITFLPIFALTGIISCVLGILINAQ